MTSQNEPTLLPAALSEQSLADLGLSDQHLCLASDLARGQAQTRQLGGARAHAPTSW